MQATDTWEGYLVAEKGQTDQGIGTLAQQLLRKRCVGISGSNKVVGALEVQQVCFLHKHILLTRCRSHKAATAAMTIKRSVTL